MACGWRVADAFGSQTAIADPEIGVWVRHVQLVAVTIEIRNRKILPQQRQDFLTPSFFVNK